LAYQARKQYAEALADYNRAIGLDAKYAEAYYNKGLIYRKTGRATEAIEAFKSFLQYAPSGDQGIEVARIAIRDLGGK